MNTSVITVLLTPLRTVTGYIAFDDWNFEGLSGQEIILSNN